MVNSGFISPKTDTRQLLRFCGIALLLMSVIFVFLYFPFLSRQYIYAYNDIGADTYTTYLPNILYDIQHLLSGDYSVYSLQRGLGEFYPCYFYKYLSIFNLPLLLLGEQHLHWGLLCSLYLKYAGICIFALLFFRRLLRSNHIALICSLLWTYCSYNVLWGQHYQNLTNMVALTASLYALQLFLEGDRKRFLLIPALASLAYSSYLCLYSSCFFFAAYSILYLAFHKVPALEILKKAGIFALSLIVAGAMAGEFLFPSIANFFQSSRTSDVTTFSYLWIIYSPNYLLSFLARLLSNNTLGAGNMYSGPSNYYEMAMLSVSILFFLSLVLLLQSKVRRRVAAISGCCAVLLCLPIVSHLLTFNATAQRWSYLLCLAELILIGYAMCQILHHWKEPAYQKKLRNSVLITDAIYLGLFALLWVAQWFFSIDLVARSVIITCCPLALYNLWFLLLPRMLGRWNARYCWSILAGLICLELVVCNYDSINLRTRITPQEWYASMYNDDTADALDEIPDQKEVYRVTKTYNSTRENDALVQGYNGLASYSSTNSAELINLCVSWGNTLYNSDKTNWISFSNGNIVSNSLLGVKYVITRPDQLLNDNFYTQLSATDSYSVFENDYWLGFGYLYTQQIDEETFLAQDADSRILLLTDAYYLTGDDSAAEKTSDGYEGLDLSDYILDLDLTGSLTEAFNCSADLEDGALVITATDDDPQLYFDLSDIPEGCSILSVEVTLTSEQDSNVQAFFSQSDSMSSFQEEDSVSASYVGGETTCLSLDLSQGDIESLRLDPSNIQQTVTISSISLHLMNDALVQENLSRLQSNCMTDFTQDGNTFTGTITNPNDEAMLCIPLLYSSRWTATVDGESVEISNINGGLVGISLSQGEHEISITYHNNTQQIGRCIGLVTLVCYLAGSVLWWRKRGRTEIAFRMEEPKL